MSRLRREGDSEMFIFPVQLTTSSIGNLTLLYAMAIHTLAFHSGLAHKINFSCSADHEQDWQPYPVDPYSVI